MNKRNSDDNGCQENRVCPHKNEEDSNCDALNKKMGIFSFPKNPNEGHHVNPRSSKRAPGGRSEAQPRCGASCKERIFPQAEVTI